MVVPNTVHLAASRDRLTAEGGRIVQVRLRKAEVKALAELRRVGGFSSDTDAIRAAILNAAKKSKKALDHAQPVMT